MIQICIVICLFLLVAFGAYAQSRGRLKVISYKGHKSKFIEEGTWVRFFKNGKKYNSHFKILSDQSILINSYTVLISQLQELSAQTFLAQIDGVVLAVPGGVIGSLGILATVDGLNVGGYGLLGVMVGVPLAGIGVIDVVKGVQLLSNGKNFPSSKWKYKVTMPSI